MNELFDQCLRLLRGERLEEAQNCFQKILDEDPDHVEARFQLANALLLQEDLHRAVDQYRMILCRKPDSPSVYLNLGHAYRKLNQGDEAKACYKKVLSYDPNHRDALFFWAVITLEKGSVESAIAQMLRLIRRYPNFPDPYFKLGIAYKSQGRLDDAVTAFHGALKIDPRLSQVFNQLGIIHKTQGHFTLAEKYYRKALGIDACQHDVLNNLGTLFHETGKYSEALAYFTKALSIRSDFALAAHNLGNTLQSTGQYEASIEYYQRAITIDPHFASAYYHCGVAYQNMKRSAKAIAMFEKSLALRPDWGKAFCALFHQAQYVCDWSRIEKMAATLDKMTTDALRQGKRPDEPPFLNVIRKQSPAENLSVAKAWSQEISRRFSGSGRRYRAYQRPSAGEPITIGYVTNRFRNAATGYLMRGLFAVHDRRQFKIHCYTYGTDDGSAYRKQIKMNSDAFVDISAMGYEAAADRIHQDGVNILVDLKGFTRNNRLGLFALRPAPVQVSYLGFAGSTGSDFHDYVIADRTVIPESESCSYTEKPVYMPHCYMVNDDTKSFSIDQWTRSDVGLPPEAFVFCSLNMPYKIESRVFRAWMDILHAVPHGVLWLMASEPACEDQLKEEAAKRGVNASRIVFASRMPIESHLSRIQLADLGLDTLTYNGHTTTSDALWAGVPVISMEGGHFMSRVSASQLRAVDMEMLIANDIAEYVRLAISIANDTNRLATLKAILRRHLRTKPLFDTKRFCINLEFAYRVMWQNYQAVRAPKPIHVPDQWTQTTIQ